MKLPMTVPTPPKSDVPPITAPATARNIRSGPPWSGTIVVMRVESRIPAKPARTFASTKLPILIRPHVDAALGRADQVPAGGEGPEPPAGPGEDRLHDEDEAQRPEELGVEEERVLLGLRAEDLVERLAARHELLRALGQVQCDAVEEEEHAERRDE